MFWIAGKFNKFLVFERKPHKNLTDLERELQYLLHEWEILKEKSNIYSMNEKYEGQTSRTSIFSLDIKPVSLKIP